jgi:formylglycine-generating enzyme required for sulfatase activity
MFEEKLNRRAFLKLAVAGMAGAILTACAAPTAVPTPAPTVQPTARAELTRAPTATRATEPTQAPQALPQGGSLTLALAVGVTLQLVRVPAGAFTMGSDTQKDPHALDIELPQHEVYLDEYLIGKYAVTEAQFRPFVQATGLKGWTDWGGQREDHPAVGINWDDALGFCAWASQVTGRKVHLPTEAQWEKAARGADARIYPWGNEPPDATRCNCLANPWDTTPAGQYSPAGDSPYGCADMAGGIWQWTSSVFKPYPYKADDGREDLADRGAERVLRGAPAQVTDTINVARLAYRDHFSPADPVLVEGVTDHSGFRVCVSPA